MKRVRIVFACCLSFALACSGRGEELPAEPLAVESYLGIRATTVTRLDELDGEGESGLTIAEVVENSPARQAGLQVGDQIVSLDGKALRTPEQLESEIAARKPGTEVELEVRRDMKRMRFKASTVPRLLPRQAPPVEKFEETRRLGVFVNTLSAAVSEGESLPIGEGVQVTGYFPGSPVEAAGVQKGDVIWKLDGEPVYGGEDFIQRVHKTPPDTELELEISRQGKRSKVAVTTSERTRSMRRLHVPGVVLYESNPRKQEATFGVLLYLFIYSRREEERTYRLFYFISWTTGDNEELRKIEP